jgi:hypothetical protein
MKRSMLVCALLVAGTMGAGAQQVSQSGQYQGVSNPPPDDQITTPMPAPQPIAKPSPAHPLTAQPAPESVAAQPEMVAPAPRVGSTDAEYGTDAGIVKVEPQMPAEPTLNERSYTSDPDGDIVHPGPLPAGELDSGTIIRARLLNGLSTTSSQAGDAFRAKVASDVFRGNQILIPEGAEIDGTVVRVSTGHFGGHGSMLLRPESVILPDGSRFQIYAQVTGTPGSNTNVGAEGNITPGSRMKKDGIEYGGAAGAGAITGAVVAGPAGALAGTVVGAGAVTVHLLMDHPQASLQSGTVVDFTLTEPLNLVAADRPAQSEQQSMPAVAAPATQPAVTQPAAAGQQQIPDIE